MKIIFLDIDGVLNSMDYLYAYHNIQEAKGEEFTRFDIYGDCFDPRCCMYLEYIIRKTKAKIVLSSMWRFSGLSNMQQMWKVRNIFGEVIDVTPSIVNSVRGAEIEAWLSTHKDVESYVILDDDTDMLGNQNNNFVKVDERYGINYNDSLKAVDILNGVNKNV
jgi:hypothetical protein